MQLKMRNRAWPARCTVAVAAGALACLLAVPAFAFSGAAPTPAVKNIFPGMTPPDPLVAAGPTDLLTTDTGSLEFFTKSSASAAGTPITLPGQSGPVVSATHFFRAQLQAANNSGKLPAAACGPTSTLPKLPSGANPEGLHPSNVGCLVAVYDTRISYDPVRKRFWIVAAVRNLLWSCAGYNLPGLHTDPTAIPNQGTKQHPTCHPEWLPSWARRYLAVAVSKTANPLQGFHKFILNANDYEDWPQFALHDHYLVVNHKDTPTDLGCACVFVFNAEALANPSSSQDGSALVIKPLEKINYAVFSALSATSEPVIPVTQHNGRADLTYLWTPVGRSWRLFALWSRHPNNPTDAPVLLFAGSVTTARTIRPPMDNAVLHDGALWFATDHCAVQDALGFCDKYAMELYAFRVNPGTADPPSFTLAKIHDRVIGADAGTTLAKNASYQKPAVEITADDDAVAVYERTGLNGATLTRTTNPPTQVRYLIWYHGASDITPGRSLKNGTGTASGLNPTCGGCVDLGGAALDPGGRTVWMSHAFAEPGGASANASGYAQVVGAVRP
jgi:hypothetical protein